MSSIKKYGVWLALVFTLAATMWAARQEESDVQVKMVDVIASSNLLAKTKPSTININDQANVSHQISNSNLLMQRPIDAEEPLNIFSTFMATENTAEKNVAESLAPVPTNPFVYAGKLVDDGNVIVFLIDGDKSHAVKSGDVIEDNWQVKSITPPVMVLKYIPSKIEVQLQIGALS